MPIECIEKLDNELFSSSLSERRDVRVMPSGRDREERQ